MGCGSSKNQPVENQQQTAPAPEPAPKPAPAPEPVKPKQEPEPAPIKDEPVREDSNTSLPKSQLFLGSLSLPSTNTASKMAKSGAILDEHDLIPRCKAATGSSTAEDTPDAVRTAYNAACERAGCHMTTVPLPDGAMEVQDGVHSVALLVIAQFSTPFHDAAKVRQALLDISKEVEASFAIKKVTFIATPANAVVTRLKSKESDKPSPLVVCTVLADPCGYMQSIPVQVPSNIQNSDHGLSRGDQRKIAHSTFETIAASMMSPQARANALDKFPRSPDLILVSGTVNDTSERVPAALPAVLQGAREAFTAYVPTVGGLSSCSKSSVVATDLAEETSPTGGDRIILTPIWVSCAVYFESVSGFSPLANGGSITKVKDDDNYTILEFDNKPAADIVSQWATGKEDVSAKELLTIMKHREPLGDLVRIDELGEQTMSLYDILSINDDDRSVTVSTACEKGQFLVLTSGEALSYVDMVSRSFRKMFTRDNFADMKPIASLAWMPEALLMEDTLRKKDEDRKGLTKASKLIDDIRGKSETALSGSSHASIISHTVIGSSATGFPASISTLNTSRLVLATPITAPVAGAASRGMVHPGFGTIVYTDIKQSTDIWQWDNDIMSVALYLHDQIMRKAMWDCAGYLLQAEGDAFMAFFRSPLDAVRFTLLVQERLNEAEWPEKLLEHPAAAVEKDDSDNVIFRGLRVRMGINLLAEEADYALAHASRRIRVYGGAVSIGARISDAGDGGQILTSAEFIAYLMQPQFKAQLPDLYANEAGMITVDTIKVQLAYITPMKLRRRKFNPLRLDRGKAGHWTAQGRRVKLDRQPNLASARSARSARSVLSQLSRASGTHVEDTQDIVSYETNPSEFKCFSVSSHKEDTEDATKACLKELASQVPAGRSLDAAVVFSSEEYDYALILKRLTDAYPNVKIVGGTIGASITNQSGWEAPKGKIHAMGIFAISDPLGLYHACNFEYGDNPTAAGKELGAKIRTTIDEFEKSHEQIDFPPAMDETLNHKPAVWMSLAFGPEEQVIEGIKQGLAPRSIRDISINGGSTGNTAAASPGGQFCNTKVHETSVSALISLPTAHVKTHFDTGYMPGSRYGVATKVNDHRVLMEIDGKPAAEVYNKWTGGFFNDVIKEGGGVIVASCGRWVLGRECGLNEFGEPKYQVIHPVAITPEMGMSCFAAIEEGEVLRVMPATDYSRRVKMAMMARHSMKQLGEGKIHGHLMAWCISLPITQPEGMQAMSASIASVLRYQPSMGGGMCGEQGQINGDLLHGNVTLSIQSFVTPSVATETFADNEQAPQGDNVAIAFATLDHYTSLLDAKPHETDLAVELFQRHARVLLYEDDIKGYACKSDQKSIMCAFPNPEACLKWSNSLQLALVSETQWPQSLLKVKQASLRKASDGSTIYNGPSCTIGIGSGAVDIRFDAISNRWDYFGRVVNLAARIGSHGADTGLIVFADDMASADTLTETGLEFKKASKATELKGFKDKVKIMWAAPKGIKRRLDHRKKSSS